MKDASKQRLKIPVRKDRDFLSVSVRVMRTGGMMGEVVGYAARMCRKYGVLPRQIYQEHLEEFIAELKAIPKKKNIELVANV